MSVHRYLPLLLPISLLGACASTEKTESPLDGAAERMEVTAWNRGAMMEQATLGLYLAQIDRSIQTWNRLFLEGDKVQDARKLSNVQIHITERVRKQFDLITHELNTGPPINRRIAAAALGFYRNDATGPALLSALIDPDDEVVANALFGLSILGDPATPLDTLSHLIEFGSTEKIRGNASLATLEILRSGSSEGQLVVEAARTGLSDGDATVRAHCALILAHQLDNESIEDLRFLLTDDPMPGVAMAAGQAIAYMGSRQEDQFGQVARVLSGSLALLEGGTKDAVIGNLRKLSERNYPRDEDWVRWAHEQPLGKL